MVDFRSLADLKDALYGTDADIAFGKLRHIIEAWEAMKPAPSQDRVEAVAAAIWETTPTHCDVSWKEAAELAKFGSSGFAQAVRDHRRKAEAALTALPPEPVDGQVAFEAINEAWPLAEEVARMIVQKCAKAWGLEVKSTKAPAEGAV